MKEFNYIHYDSNYGTVNCFGQGAIRDMFEEGLKTMSLPRDVDKALNDLCLAIYKETGEMPTLNIE
jgi:hypothetical protein